MSFLSEFQHVTKIYPGTLSPVLDDISFSVSYRDSIAILGPSGSGKTTLLNILGTLDRPTSGQLIMEGEQTANLDKNKLAELRNQRIGFVFQLHYLLPQLNLIENVLLPLLPEKDNIRKSAARDRAFHLLEKVGLKSLVHQQPASLSVGECQRAAVVRALINQPILLLADEPTGSLDSGTASILAALLSDLCCETEISMVVVTHSMELALNMEKVYQLKAGKLEMINKNNII